MKYKFECNLDDKDYYEFNKYHFLNSPDMKKSNFIWKISVPIFFLIILLYSILNNYDKLYILVSIFLFSIASFVWCWSYKYLTILFLKFYIKLLKKNGKMPYSSNSTVQFFDDYFEEVTTDTKSEIKYTAILRVDISENNNIYIYTNPILAYIIPFSCFKSVEQQEEFLKFIKEKML